MQSRLKIIPPAAASLLVLGCQSSPPAASDGQNSESHMEAMSPVDATSPAEAIPPVEAITLAEDATAFPAARTATLWVNGLACPF